MKNGLATAVSEAERQPKPLAVLKVSFESEAQFCLLDTGHSRLSHTKTLSVVTYHMQRCRSE